MKLLSYVWIAAMLALAPATASAQQDIGGQQGNQGSVFQQGQGQGAQSEILSFSNEQGYEGNAVFDANDEEIGEVSNLWVNQNQQPQYATIAIGGMMGMGEQQLLVPFSDLQRTGQDGFKMNLTREELEQQQPQAGQGFGQEAGQGLGQEEGQTAY